MQKEAPKGALKESLPPDHVISEICGVVSISFISLAAIHSIDYGWDNVSTFSAGVATLYTCLGILGLRPDEGIF